MASKEAERGLSYSQDNEAPPVVEELLADFSRKAEKELQYRPNEKPSLNHELEGRHGSKGIAVACKELKYQTESMTPEEREEISEWLKEQRDEIPQGGWNSHKARQGYEAACWVMEKPELQDERKSLEWKSSWEDEKSERLAQSLYSLNEDLQFNTLVNNPARGLRGWKDIGEHAERLMGDLEDIRLNNGDGSQQEKLINQARELALLAAETTYARIEENGTRESSYGSIEEGEKIIEKYPGLATRAGMAMKLLSEDKESPHYNETAGIVGDEVRNSLRYLVRELEPGWDLPEKVEADAGIYGARAGMALMARMREEGYSSPDSISKEIIHEYPLERNQVSEDLKGIAERHGENFTMKGAMELIHNVEGYEEMEPEAVSRLRRALQNGVRGESPAETE